MAKHPVPKQKQSKARSSRRYKTFANKARIKLTNATQLTTCEACQAPVVLHHACVICGNYRGNSTERAVKKAAKVTTIKAE